VKVRGHVEFRTIFSNGMATNTIMLRYILVDVLSSYNLLLRRPSVNKLRTVVSTQHLKMKLVSLERGGGGIVTLKVDKKMAKKYYDNSLKTR